MYRENPFLTQIISLVLAAGLHALVLFGHFTLQASTIGDEGIGSVDLAPGPPGDPGEFEEPPPPPPPPPPPAPGESLPEPPAEEEAMAEEPKADDIPEPDAEVKEKKDEQPKINVQYESPVYSTNKMSAEEAQRAIEFLLKHGRPGTGHVGSKPGGGGGGGGGKRYGDVLCKKCPYPEYPYEARKLRQEGMVTLRALIGPDGRIVSIVVREGSGRTLLDQSALQKVRKWEFEPKKLAGMAVSTQVDIPIKFEMERGVASSPTEGTPPEGSQ